MKNVPGINPRFEKNLIRWVLIGGGILLLLLLLLPRGSNTLELEISQVIEMAQAGQLAEIEVQGDRLNLTTVDGQVFRSRKEGSVRNCHEITRPLLHAQLYLMGDS